MQGGWEGAEVQAWSDTSPAQKIEQPDVSCQCSGVSEEMVGVFLSGAPHSYQPVGQGGVCGHTFDASH